MELDKSLEESWRGLITGKNLHWLKKRLEDQRIASLKARAIFEELHLAAGERVLKEHE
ncbi:hypothetical protein LCGC14_2532990 [marine sediment metagenome]|uniref:Uncharacterized protein n=1 Tax=marine sediment metagenome TaxID=412755 RepID=A0A0F9DLA3_9ZZZZ